VIRDARKDIEKQSKILSVKQAKSKAINDSKTFDSFLSDNQVSDKGLMKYIDK
jgi:hypothetical protein